MNETSSSSSSSVEPTFEGFVESTRDALLLFQGVINQTLPMVPRRPHERERESLIRSGAVFVYEENSSAIKRWTDGIAWSPSRIIGNFLIYRELKKPFAPGEKKRATKVAKRRQASQQRYSRATSDGDGSSPGSHHSSHCGSLSPQPHSSPEEGEMRIPDLGPELERMLVGSLVDSYGFKPDGLIKKTISVQFGAGTYHMVSYYRLSDFVDGPMKRPVQDPRCSHLTIHQDLVNKQSFRQIVDSRGVELSQPSETRYPNSPSLPGTHPGQVVSPACSEYDYQSSGYSSIERYDNSGYTSAQDISYAYSPNGPREGSGFGGFGGRLTQRHQSFGGQTPVGYHVSPMGTNVGTYFPPSTHPSPIHAIPTDYTSTTIGDSSLSRTAVHYSHNAIDRPGMRRTAPDHYSHTEVANLPRTLSSHYSHTVTAGSSLPRTPAANFSTSIADGGSLPRAFQSRGSQGLDDPQYSSSNSPWSDNGPNSEYYHHQHPQPPHGPFNPDQSSGAGYGH
ncbi:Gti1/Pac2 family-domain-containing protein [Tuber borchii]|uniref:Gti1/Pac2 family-domain-containing protein n=1 Tax=Tuber borchii TaxID=42251 RepID=A0A2T6ZUG7_TUBBO|nr:Gti1/Pac2 family-domain-containing protein [Tuber borchii]